MVFSTYLYSIISPGCCSNGCRFLFLVAALLPCLQLLMEACRNNLTLISKRIYAGYVSSSRHPLAAKYVVTLNTPYLSITSLTAFCSNLKVCCGNQKLSKSSQTRLLANLGAILYEISKINYNYYQNFTIRRIYLKGCCICHFLAVIHKIPLFSFCKDLYSEVK